MTRHPRTPLARPIPTPADLPGHFLCVRQAEATKLGQRAHGAVTYQILLDPARERVFVRVTANAGSGSFSSEPVDVAKLHVCVSHRDKNKPLRSSVMQPAILGKSSCNAGFIGAVLVTEGLLARDSEKRHDLLDLGLWQSWMATQQAAPGNLAEVRLKAEVVDHKKETKDEPGVGVVVEPGDPVDAAAEPADALAGDVGQTDQTGVEALLVEGEVDADASPDAAPGVATNIAPSVAVTFKAHRKFKG